ncbi:MAG: hypothetical protein V1720_10285 [bacterium]
MKYFFIKFYSIIIIVILYAINTFAQSSLHKQKEFADSLFNAANYFDAITEYKRLEFFDKDSSYSFQTYLQIGMCYKHGAFFDEAIKYFSKAAWRVESKEELFDTKIQIVRSNILRRTTQQSIFLLDQLAKEFMDDNYQMEILYWRGWSFIFANEWGKAAHEFEKIDQNHELKILCNQVEDEKYSVTFAKVISYILPGFGQIYTGNVLSGLMSLGWNLLWGYTAVTAFKENRNFDGIAVGSMLWMRFYRGNIQNAQKFVEKRNTDITNKTLRYLQNDFNGVKP